jgi:hypothetical protein
MKKYIFILLVFLAFGCDKAKQSVSSSDMEMAEGTPIQLGFSANKGNLKDASTFSSIEPVSPTITENLKLIKTGNVTFESENLDKTAKEITAAIQKHGGYASSENESKSSYQIDRSISIRVPSDNFDALLAEISKGVDRFDNREISVSDVTEEFVDMSARVKTKKQIESRYIQLLSKAGKITDMLEVEAKLGEIRIDIERIEGRLRYINNQVGLSTLNINYYETLAMTSTQNSGFFYKVKNGFVKGWDLILSLIIGLVTIWPLVLLGVGGLFFFRRLRKKSSN